ncbi:MAG: hypothetical protein IKU04_07680 [Bacteroidales bacterium]|nr:hypothetical protein [Bacteroidales bacterium]
MTDREQFDSKVVPVMDRVRDELQRKQAEELRRYMRSPAYILAGGAGPDGGMGSQAMALDSLNVTGEWNSKTVEDYVGMVKDELRKEQIEVTPEIEEMMIDKMVRDQMPKSSIEYILRKAGSNTLFGLPQETRKTPLQREIEERGERLYNPSAVEKGIGWGLGAAADFVAFGGMGGGVASGLKFVGADLALNAVIDTVDTQQRKEMDVPKVIAPGHEQEWLDENGPQESPAVSETPKSQPDTELVQEGQKEREERGKEGQVAGENQGQKEESSLGKEVASEAAEPQQHTIEQKTNTSGWQGILTGLGLNGLGDIGRNAGYILAMLPDMLLGMFTGKTQSLGIRDNLVPIASIMAGLFVKNPLLKMTLIGLGGANLLNKAGHEQLAKQEGMQQQTVPQVRYRQYEDEQMDPRIRDAQVRGSNLIATVDGIPVTIALPEKVVDAYNQGALPLGKLANAVLERCDRLQQIDDARERFEQESRTETRGITQR